MAPKRIVFSRDSEKESESSGGFLSKYPFVLESISATAEVRNFSTSREDPVEEDELGVSLQYVTSQANKEPKFPFFDELRQGSSTRKTFQSSFEVPSMDTDGQTGYPDDTDNKNDIKEFNAWKLRRRKRETN